MYLPIYLNDHLAGATVGRELARRSAANNSGPIYGAFLQQLTVEIDEDRESLIRLMRALDVNIDRVKVVGGWAAEKVGRLKLNGRLRGYSPLSRLVELEMLTLGVRGKLGLWLALKELAREDQRMMSVDLQELATRAERQLEGLEEHRLRAVPEALLG
ncbi:MAG: hypothetical protein ACYDHN_11970 [Solirubrobacteraceae bacterium]